MSLMYARLDRAFRRPRHTPDPNCKNASAIADVDLVEKGRRRTTFTLSPPLACCDTLHSARLAAWHNSLATKLHADRRAQSERAGLKRGKRRQRGKHLA